MRSPVLIASSVSLALVAIAGPISLAQAELQWQRSGVQQAAHAQAPEPTRFERPQPVRRAKAPTVGKPAVRQAAVAPTPVAKPAPAVVQATGVLSAAATATASGVRSDPALTTVCHNCGDGACGCGGADSYYVEEPSCGVVGCGDAACGLTYGEPCGCGDIGCAGECGDICGCGDVCSCGARSLGGCSDRGAVPLVLYVPPIQELTFFGGVQAFKNPLDAGRDRGNFGVHEGVNVGGRMAWLPLPQLGYQIGYRATHSQLHGDFQSGTSDHHTQQFFTAGLFHRKPVGLQYGVVYDVLNDERQETVDFGQVRGLISITNPRGNEFGFTFASHTSDNMINNVLYHAADQYLLFYRKHGPCGGEFRAFGGFDDDSNGLVGGDLSVPLTDRWSLDTGFTYMIPEEDQAGIGSTQEAWNLTTSLVWHYGKRAKKSYGGQYRPLFNVADNGSLIIDSQP